MANGAARLKDNFLQVDVEEVVTKVSGLLLYAWNCRAEAASVRHLGPTAEAFHAAFGLGNNVTSGEPSLELGEDGQAVPRNAR